MRDSFLEFDRLEELQRSNEADIAVCLARLADLAPHRDDHLVSVRSWDVGDLRPRRLTVFSPGGSKWYFLAATEDGTILLGDPEKPERPSTSTLPGFDEPSKLVSLGVTRRLAIGSARKDVLLVCQRYSRDYSNPKTIAYHGIVSIVGGVPTLRPAHDDSQSSRPDTWIPVDVAELRDWLSIPGFAATADVDPLDPPFPGALPSGEIKRMVVSKDLAIVVTGATTTIRSAAGTIEPKPPPAGSVLAVTLARGKAIICADDSTVTAYESTGTRLWSQKTSDLIIAATSLPSEGDVEHDLLFATQNGRILRLKLTSDLELRKTWDSLWNRICPNDLESRLRLADRTFEEGHPLTHRRVAVLAAVESALEKATSADVPAESVKRIASLFAVHEPGIELLLEPLLASLRKGSKFAAILLADIYPETPIAVQGFIDRHVRTCHTFPTTNSGEFLEKKALRTRGVLLDTTALEKEPERKLVRAYIKLEEWSNAYLPQDTIRIPQTEPIIGLAILRQPNEPPAVDSRIVIATRTGLHWFELHNDGTLPSEPTRSTRNLTIRAATIHPGRRALLTWTPRGLVCSDPTKDTVLPISWRGVPLETFDRLACTTEADGGHLLAAVSSAGFTATMVVFRLGAETGKELFRTQLPLPGIGALGIIGSKHGFLRVVAGAETRTDWLTGVVDEKGQLKETKLRNLTAGVRCVAFGSDETVVAVGDRNGFIWCFDPTQDEPFRELRWIYKLRGSLGEIHSARDGFLAGSEDGRLVLLEASNGRRIWKHRLPSGVRHVAVSQTQTVVVGTTDGWLSTFTRVSEPREQSLNEVRSLLSQVDATTIEKKGELPVRAFASLKLEPRKGHNALLEIYDDRKTRARILRDYVEVSGAGSGNDLSLESLTFRDLMLLMSYLHEPDASLGASLARALRRPPASGRDNSASAAAAAWATWLVRTPHDSPSSVARQLDPASFATRWVRFEVARYLVDWALGRVGASSDPRFFSTLLEGLIHFPPSVVGALVAVAPPSSKATRSLEALHQVLTRSTNLSLPLTEPATLIAANLEPVEKQSWLCGLAYRLATFHALPIPEKDEWPDIRCSSLEALDYLAAALRDPRSASSHPALDILIKGQKAFPSTPRPADAAPLLDRRAWIQEAKRRTALLMSMAPLPTANSWTALAQALLARLCRRLQKFLDLEDDHLARLVRPRLTVTGGVVRLPHQQVRVSLLVEPEGDRTLKDVTISLSATGDDGLWPPGKRQDRREFAAYPGPSTKFPTTLEGMLHPDQARLIVVATLVSGDGRRHEERWSFSVPREPLTAAMNEPFPSGMPESFEALRDTILNTKQSVVVVVIDERLGRQSLIDSLSALPRVNLDIALDPFGLHRTYHRQLDLELILQKLGLAPSSCHNLLEDRLLIGPIDRTIHRAFAGEAPLLAPAFGAWLSSRSRQPQARPQLILFASSRSANILRPHLVPEAVEMSACQPIPAWRTSSTSPFHRELASWLLSHVVDGANASGYLDAIGFDLRCATDAVRLALTKRNSSLLQPADLLRLAEARAELLGELRSVKPLSLILAILGSAATTTLDRVKVVPGHVAAQNFRSGTTKQAPKLIQSAGAPYTHATLEDIAADRSRPPHLSVEGLETGLTSSTPPSLRPLLDLAAIRGRALRDDATLQLTALGVADLLAGVLRTRPPYRELIRQLLSDATAEPYQAVMGSEYSPLQAISFDELAIAPLDRILPSATATNRRSLASLARLWKPKPTTEALDRTVSTLFGAEARLLDRNDAGSWTESLASIPDVSAVEVRVIGEDPLIIFFVRTPLADLHGVRTAIATSEDRLAKSPTAANKARPLRTLLLGPGADQIPNDPDRRVAVIRSLDLCVAATKPNMAAELRYLARARQRLLSWSPFTLSGALPPGSPLFVGREDELDFIKSRISEASVTVVAGRRIGKTSLLKQVEHWLRHSQLGMIPYYVDLRNLATAEEFAEALAAAFDKPALAALPARRVVDAVVSATPGLPVFILNEVDALIRQASAAQLPDSLHLEGSRRDARILIDYLRQLSENKRAQFLLSGHYPVVPALQDPRSAAFNWTVGTDFSGRAIRLGSLSGTAARKLLAVLTEGDLRLRWAAGDDRERSEAKLLARSHRVPWILQSFGHNLLAALDQNQSDELSESLVDRMLDREQDTVWNYFQDIFSSLQLSSGSDQATQSALQFALFAVAREKYFLPSNPPILDPDLSLRDPVGLDFTLAELISTAEQTANGLTGEARKLVDWFKRLDWGEALNALCLTLALERNQRSEVPDSASPRYHFYEHIIPLELQLRLMRRPGKLIDDIVLETADELATLLARSIA